MKVLHLTLKKQWFDMIASGEKLEEYREIKPYWVSRLIDWSDYPKEEPNEHKYIVQNIVYDIENGHNPDRVLLSFFSKFKSFVGILFINGYSGGARRKSYKFDSISIGEGRPEWGAEPGKKYFIIKFSPLIPKE